MAVQTGQDFGNGSGIKLWRKQFSLRRLNKILAGRIQAQVIKTKTKDQPKRKDLEIARKKIEQKTNPDILVFMSLCAKRYNFNVVKAITLDLTV